MSPDDEISEKVFADIQENLNTMIEEYNEVYEDTDAAPITLTKEKVKELLIDSGVPEEVTEKIEASYHESFGENPPLAESLIDKKLIKANSQKKKEEKLIEQVEKLEHQLEEVTKITETDDDSVVEDEPETMVEDNPPAVVLHVKPDKLPMIKTELIDGQRCIVVPMNDDEQVTINGKNDLF